MLRIFVLIFLYNKPIEMYSSYSKPINNNFCYFISFLLCLSAFCVVFVDDKIVMIKKETVWYQIDNVFPNPVTFIIVV